MEKKKRIQHLSSNSRYKKRYLESEMKNWLEVVPDMFSAMKLKEARVFDIGGGYGAFLLACAKLNLLRPESRYIDANWDGCDEEVFTPYKMTHKYFLKRNIIINHCCGSDASIPYATADLVVKMWVPRLMMKEALRGARPKFLLTSDHDNQGVEELGYKLIDSFFHCKEENLSKEYLEDFGKRKSFLLYERVR